MTHSARPSSTEHPVALGSFRSWMQLMAMSLGVDRGYRARAGFVALTTLLTSPLRLWETARYGRAIAQTSVHPSPIFIIGHWRSGTTHLHNLLNQDPALGTLSTFQAMAPGFCIIGDKRIKPLLAKFAHRRYPTRLIDNIPLVFDAPQEDEFALASHSPRSFLHGFTFPRHAAEFFSKYVLFDDLSESERGRWIRTYLWLLRKTTLASQGRRLVIKNCAHSARIRTLLELFPDAKFVFIHRNPYEVFLSTMHMHKTVLPRSQLQDITLDRVEANVLQFYTLLMNRYLEARAHIPAGNLVEVRYENLETDPLGQLRMVYGQLGLPRFAEVNGLFRSYIESISDYKKNAYTLDDRVIATVNEHWRMAFEEWGYDRVESSFSTVNSVGG